MSGSGQTLVQPGQQFNGYGYSAGAGNIWNVYIGGAPPVSPAAGSLWFDSVGVELYVYYNDGNSSQWVPATTAPPGPAGPPGASGSYQTGPGLHINSGTTPPTIDVATPYLALTGGTLTGSLVLAADPTVALGAATKEYADTKLPLAGGTLTGALTPSGGIVGVTNGVAAAAGQVGQVVSTIISTVVSLPDTQQINIGSISLPAGDWDVWGEVWFQGGAATATGLYAWVTPTSASLPGTISVGTGRSSITAPSATVNPVQLAIAPIVANVSAATTYYLGAMQTNGTTGWTGTGKIVARRVR